jgi:hypothetical protein
MKFDQYLNTVPTIGFNCEKIRGTVGRAKGVSFLVWGENIVLKSYMELTMNSVFRCWRAGKTETALEKLHKMYGWNHIRD